MTIELQRRFTFLILLGALVAPDARADWPGDAQPVCPVPARRERFVAIGDLLNGAFIAWGESRGNGNDVYVQHWLWNGTLDPAWPSNGALAAGGTGAQAPFGILADGAGGCFVSFLTPTQGIRCQHLSSQAQPTWPANGVSVVASPFGTPLPPSMTRDASGGVYIAGARLSTSVAIYADHLRSDGTQSPGWNAVSLAGANAREWTDLAAVSDEQGGVFLVLGLVLNAPLTQAAVKLFRFTTAGTRAPGWTPSGALVCATTGARGSIRSVADGTGGVYVTWIDERSGSPDVYLARHLASGERAPGWPENGLAVCAQPAVQGSSNVTRLDDGSAMVVWQDQRNNNLDVFACAIRPDGTFAPGWGSQGSPIAVAPEVQDAPALIADGERGAYVVWRVAIPAHDFDLWTTRVTERGDTASPPAGKPLAQAPSDQSGPVLLPGKTGTAIAVWTDGRNGPADVFLRQLDIHFTLDAEPGEAPRDFLLAGARPQPARGALFVAFTLPDDGPARLELFDLAGRRLADREVGVLGAGPHRIELAAARAFAPGLYFARLTRREGSLTARVVIAE